jgi:hypothetical protein
MDVRMIELKRAHGLRLVHRGVFGDHLHLAASLARHDVTGEFN